VYDAASKKPKKISGACLGAITEKEGFKESLKRLVAKQANLLTNSSVSVKEYGVSYLIYKKWSIIIQTLEKYFPDSYKQIIAIAYCRFVYHCPLKSIPYRLETSFIYQLFDLPVFNDKTSSQVLHNIGSQTDNMHQYMRSFIGEDEYILMDGTSIMSKSDHISLSKVGYNKSNNFDGQINLLYVYSATTMMPIFYRLLSGNIRDVKAFKNTLALSGINKAVIVTDKGFYSKANINLLKQEQLSFIIPLKRDNSQIDYTSLENNTYKKSAEFFSHEKRIIWSKQIELEDGIIHLFLDDNLKLKEENDYLLRISNQPETYTLEKFHNKSSAFGTISLLTPTSLNDSTQVYRIYKSRMFIETMFDGMKNVLDSDHTYMQNEQTLQGWMFINHICLQWYQSLYIELKEKDLIKKISVNDYIQQLTDIKKVNINQQWHLNEFTNATKKLLVSIGIDIYNT
jgi:transposase